MQPETSIFRVDGLTWEDLESMIRCMSPDMKKEKVLIDTCATITIYLCLNLGVMRCTI